MIKIKKLENQKIVVTNGKVIHKIKNSVGSEHSKYLFSIKDPKYKILMKNEGLFVGTDDKGNNLLAPFEKQQG